MTHTKTGMFKSWHGVKIRQLSENTVYVPADDEMAVITVHFEGDVKPRTFVMALDGRVPTFVDITYGAEYLKFVRAEYRESCEVVD